MPRRGSPDAYRVAIPSYQRPEVLATQTLTALAAGRVDPGRVTVYVHAHDPAVAAYREVTAAAGVALQVTTTRGINAQRRHITAAYPEGSAVLQMDDDLRGVVVATGPKTVTTLTDLDGFIRDMFYDASGRDLWVWGVAPTKNAFFLTPGKRAEGLKFCIGAFLGCYTRPGHPVHDTTVETKEDYELCLRAWWYDGAILRHDGAAPDAAHYSPGGCTDLRTQAAEETSTATLLRDWPGLVRRNTRRRSGYAEILLTPKRRGRPRRASTPIPGSIAVSA